MSGVRGLVFRVTTCKTQNEPELCGVGSIGALGRSGLQGLGFEGRLRPLVLSGVSASGI